MLCLKINSSFFFCFHFPLKEKKDGMAVLQHTASFGLYKGTFSQI